MNAVLIDAVLQVPQAILNFSWFLFAALCEVYCPVFLMAAASFCFFLVGTSQGILQFRYCILFCLLIKNIFNVYFLREKEIQRERENTQVGEGQRERETQNVKQAPGSELTAHARHRAPTQKL